MADSKKPRWIKKEKRASTAVGKGVVIGKGLPASEGGKKAERRKRLYDHPRSRSDG